MIRIAVTGGIGSGKSFVAKLFNYPVFNADNEVSKIYNQDKSCFLKIKKALPKFILSNSLKKNELTNDVNAANEIVKHIEEYLNK